MISSHVGLLLTETNPATITLSVVAVVVNAIKGHAFWTLSHIVKEVAKIQPAFTYADSAPSVTKPCMMPAPCTSRHHGHP